MRIRYWVRIGRVSWAKRANIAVETYPCDGRSLVCPLRMFLHVLGQISLLRVGLAAILAYVSLQML